MSRAGIISDGIADQYSVRRAQKDISGEALRRYQIPGGGFASFMEAVRVAGFATKLGISEKQAANLAGIALTSVGAVMGYPFAVTPGFQNKQISAFNLLTNMIAQGVITDDLPFDVLFETVETIFTKGDAPETEVRINTLFLPGLPPKIIRFLSGEMPAEAAVHRDNDVIGVHPCVRAAIPRIEAKEVLESRFPRILASAKELHQLARIIHH
jgi:hypothetical protein